MNCFRDGKLSIYGSKKDVERALEVLSSIQGLSEMSEGEARLRIQDAIHENSLEADIVYDDNTVYNMDKMLSNLRQIIKNQSRSIVLKELNSMSVLNSTSLRCLTSFKLNSIPTA